MLARALLCFENNKAGRTATGSRGAIEMSRLADYIDVLREAANDIIPGDRYFEERSYLNTARKSDTGSVMGSRGA